MMTVVHDGIVRDSVVIGYLHPGEVAHSFMHSMRQLMHHDLVTSRRIRGYIAQECGAGRITDGRNDVVRRFLQTDAEWLAFIDADMGFEPDTIDRLLMAAHPSARPIVGALCFGQRRGPDGPAASRHLETFPTIYRWIDSGDIAGVAPIYDYPRNQLVECDATGGACFVVHRTVLDQLAETLPQPRAWFDETVYKGQVFGEDLTFFRRCAEHGHRILVHTGIRTSHYKHVYLTEDTVPDVTVDTPTFVVVPVKGRNDLTFPLLRELDRQGGYRQIFLFDNGSDPDELAELVELASELGRIEIVDAAGANIHQMWNGGIERAVAAAWPCNVAILNNDIIPGPDMLAGLARTLRADPQLAAVCPNYDGREGSGVEYVEDLCAGRYDGTGGLAGFAFMLKGEAGYRFPEQLNWWYGDNDMLASILFAGSTAGIVLDVTVEHVDGGSQTGRWDDADMRALLEQDRRWFESKWDRQLQTA